MTKDEILNMPPSKDMDMLIEEKIFKRHPCDKWYLLQMTVEGGIYMHGDSVCEYDNKCYMENNPPKYSTNISAAWKIVERMQGDWWKMEFLTGIHAAEFEKPNMKCENQTYHEATADTMPLAICRAALLTTLED